MYVCLYLSLLLRYGSYVPCPYVVWVPLFIYIYIYTLFTCWLIMHHTDAIEPGLYVTQVYRKMHGWWRCWIKFTRQVSRTPMHAAAGIHTALWWGQDKKLLVWFMVYQCVWTCCKFLLTRGHSFWNFLKQDAFQHIGETVSVTFILYSTPSRHFLRRWLSLFIWEDSFGDDWRTWSTIYGSKIILEHSSGPTSPSLF